MKAFYVTLLCGILAGIAQANFQKQKDALWLVPDQRDSATLEMTDSRAASFSLHVDVPQKESSVIEFGVAVSSSPGNLAGLTIDFDFPSGQLVLAKDDKPVLKTLWSRDGATTNPKDIVLSFAGASMNISIRDTVTGRMDSITTYDESYATARYLRFYGKVTPNSRVYVNSILGIKE